MTKFQVGDLVKNIRPRWDIPLNTKGIVRDLSTVDDPPWPNIEWLDIEHIHARDYRDLSIGWWNPEMFELIAREE